MGEEEWRVHRTGAPSLDHLRRGALFTREQLSGKLQLDLGLATSVVAYHPVTLALDTTQEAEALFTALAEIPEQLVFCYPNADAGSRALVRRTKHLLASRGSGRLFTNLDAVTYWSLLREARMLIGNSSSGIMEAGSFAVPTVNVGMRQQGRERAPNVIDATAETSEIQRAIAQARSEQFRESLKGMANPYGDGHASEKIVEVLTTVPLGQQLLIKRHAPLNFTTEMQKAATT
jgi:UDP-N-acetylglucosamine 2-epimerase (non-hydrolysing)/GDP/UDP-N,N'-diacetylbacillosamine 2-epimerase (hydrolysing)